MRPRPRTSRRRRSLGQHFLTDRRVLERTIARADLRPDDIVLEIGPGLGILTRRLLEEVASVIAIELDPAMILELERQALAPEKLRLVRGDAAKIDYETLGPFNKVVANLPYSASSPITFRLLRAPFEVAVLMYQLEFAQRLAAKQGDPEYGRLSAACAYYASVEILEKVPSSAFHPPPEVDSAVVRLRPHLKPPFNVGSPATYEELLRFLFSTRRKTIRSTLRRHHEGLGLTDWDAVESILEARGWGDRRPEELAPAELGAIDVALEALRHGR